MPNRAPLATVHRPSVQMTAASKQGRKHRPKPRRRRRRVGFATAQSERMRAGGHAVALHAMYYNFVRIHQTLKVTPAMAAGVTDRLWEMADVVDMLEAWENSRH
jgi:hypothetical protein